MLKAILNLLIAHLGISTTFANILEPVLESASNTMLGDATVAAQPIVTGLEKGTLPSSEKLESAVTQLVADFKAEGKALLPQVAHLAVELALAKIRSVI